MLGSDTNFLRLLEDHQAGHHAARNALVERSLERFRLLARRMFRAHGDLRATTQTDDIVQLGMVRFFQALATVKPASAREFFGLAARQIRWVLKDLGQKANKDRAVHYTGLTAPDNGESAAEGPEDIFQWAEFHERIEGLPAEDREMFDLIIYEGLSQAEVSQLLQVSVRTVKRRWQRARLILRDGLRGEWPRLD